MKYDSIIWDLDGTLWDSTDGIIETWNLILKDHPEISRTVTREDMASNFGLPIRQIGRNMFPETTPEVSDALMQECGEKENIYLAEHGGTLFPEETEILERLAAAAQRGMYIVSNCQTGYIESFYSGNGLGRFFLDQECMGNTGLSKAENIRLVMERNGLEAPVFIGDTDSDRQAAKESGIDFIHASYGFGDPKEGECAADSFKDLLKALGI
ncbi:MAG: HAD family hydrolase [Lachnospiraceae bacterium]|nr:HAD family hydrolase [Lachnospiraceae bacterium]